MSLPPPTYDEQRTQLLISPSPGSVNFQKGYLGAQGERAAIEGELQIKGTEEGQWDSATISLQTIESTSQQTIEISSSTLVLFSRARSSSSPPPSNTIPSTLPFSIPLTPDTPQCIHTAHSSIAHHLVATLHPADPMVQALTKSISVHTKRYTSHNRPLLQPRPRLIQRDAPVLVKVEIPRTTFRIGEPIAIYVTIPPPSVNVISGGLRLRNVMAELVRVVSLSGGQPATEPEAIEIPRFPDPLSVSNDFSLHQNADEKSDPTYTSCDSHGSPSILDGSQTILTRSGSQCRFHSSRPVQIRLLLHPQSLRNSYGETSHSSAEQIDNDGSDCISITQDTLLHRVSFYVAVHISFMLAASQTESITSINIPVVLLPNPAPLPEIDESVASAYRKKHDRPPARTVRHEDADSTENEAGPSAINPSGAPPPFEERDAPPPFFESDSISSTSSRLPTFLESESDLGGHVSGFLEDTLGDDTEPTQHYILIPGEGSDFGFSPSDQYDGISSPLHRPASPPPSMANATLDTDVTEFANLVSQPEHAMGQLSLALEQPPPERGTVHSAGHSDALPPLPPLLDDPSDPPPSIDVEEFRRPPAPTLSRESSPPPSSLPSAPRPVTVIPQSTSTASAPPPYLQRSEHSEPEEPVMRPPPYVDVLPPHESPR